VCSVTGMALPRLVSHAINHRSYLWIFRSR
jgi:hypothetical protein